MGAFTGQVFLQMNGVQFLYAGKEFENEICEINLSLSLISLSIYTFLSS